MGMAHLPLGSAYGTTLGWRPKPLRGSGVPATGRATPSIAVFRDGSSTEELGFFALSP